MTCDNSICCYENTEISSSYIKFQFYNIILLPTYLVINSLTVTATLPLTQLLTFLIRIRHLTRMSQSCIVGGPNQLTLQSLSNIRDHRASRRRIGETWRGVTSQMPRINRKKNWHAPTAMRLFADAMSMNELHPKQRASQRIDFNATQTYVPGGGLLNRQSRSYLLIEWPVWDAVRHHPALDMSRASISRWSFFVRHQSSTGQTTLSILKLHSVRHVFPGTSIYYLLSVCCRWLWDRNNWVLIHHTASCIWRMKLSPCLCDTDMYDPWSFALNVSVERLCVILQQNTVLCFAYRFLLYFFN